MRIGHGYDVHRLVSGRALILGGVTIPYEKGLDGHSDADVLVHAVMDALLGAAAMGDIGKLFPDNDDRYLGADSMELLREVSRRLAEGPDTASATSMRPSSPSGQSSRRISSRCAGISRAHCIPVLGTSASRQRRRSASASPAPARGSPPMPSV